MEDRLHIEECNQHEATHIKIDENLFEYQNSMIFNEGRAVITYDNLVALCTVGLVPQYTFVKVTYIPPPCIAVSKVYRSTNKISVTISGVGENETEFWSELVGTTLVPLTPQIETCLRENNLI